MKTQFTEDEIYEKTVNFCDVSLAEFRKLNAELLGELIAKIRFDDLIKVLYKQGFLKGMQHSRKMRDEIKAKF